MNSLPNLIKQIAVFLGAESEIVFKKPDPKAIKEVISIQMHGKKNYVVLLEGGSFKLVNELSSLKEQLEVKQWIEANKM